MAAVMAVAIVAVVAAAYASGVLLSRAFGGSPAAAGTPRTVDGAPAAPGRAAHVLLTAHSRGYPATHLEAPLLDGLTVDSGVGGTGVGTVSSLAVTAKPLYTVAFTESGLPSGTEWWVNLSNGQSFSSLTTGITFSESGGSYTYTLGTSNKSYSAPGGTFKVHRAALSELVTFSLVTYPVTFTESGLPSGTEWWVDLTDGQSFNTSSSSQSISEPNGTYNYTVATSNTSYSASGGSFAVDGAPGPISVTFSLVTYAITFTERGLPTVTEWWVNLTNGWTFSSWSATVTFSASNGSYTFTVATANRTYSAPGGNFTIYGAPVSNTVTFAQINYTVTFTESGLPSGTEWWVNVSGQSPQSSMGSAIAQTRVWRPGPISPQKPCRGYTGN